MKQRNKFVILKTHDFYASFQMSSFATYKDKIFVLFSNGTLEARSLPGIKTSYFSIIVKIIIRNVLCVGWFYLDSIFSELEIFYNAHSESC